MSLDSPILYLTLPEDKIGSEKSSTVQAPHHEMSKV